MLQVAGWNPRPQALKYSPVGGKIPEGKDPWAKNPQNFLSFGTVVYDCLLSSSLLLIFLFILFSADTFPFSLLCRDVGKCWISCCHWLHVVQSCQQQTKWIAVISYWRSGYVHCVWLDLNFSLCIIFVLVDCFSKTFFFTSSLAQSGKVPLNFQNAPPSDKNIGKKFLKVKSYVRLSSSRS